jgi:enamine deaminase RidA (YjgF/YER057c/UK114 family)
MSIDIAVVDAAQHPSPAYPQRTFSPALMVGGALVVSGTTASTYDIETRHMVITGDIVRQSQTALEKIHSLLDSAHLNSRDVVRVVEYVAPSALRSLRLLARVRNEFLSEARAVVSTVCVRSLLRPNAQIEFEVTAFRDLRNPFAHLVYLPSCWPLDDQGQPGTTNGQLQAAFRQAARTLHQYSLRPVQVASITAYVIPEVVMYAHVLEHLRAELLAGSICPVSIVVMDNVWRAGMKVQLEIVASRLPLIHSEVGTQSGSALIISGVTAPSAGDVVEQLGAIYERLSRLGVRLVRTVEYVVPRALGSYRETATVRSRLLPRPFPCATGVVCSALLPKDAQVAVAGVAVMAGRVNERL